MAPYKCFVWWFMIGVGITAALVLLQQGLSETMQDARSVWTLSPGAVLMTVLGCGLLAGCSALISEYATGGGRDLLHH
jgi:hypothetical protein